MRALIIFGLIAIFLAGCTQLSSSPAAPQTPQTQHLCSDGTTIVTDLSQCPQVDNEMLQCQKESSTEDTNGNSPRNTCLFNLAIERSNVSICKELYTSQPDYADYTAAKCGAQIADTMNDPSICDHLGLVSSSGCYSQLATSAQDPSICDSIKSGAQKDNCLYSYISANEYSIDDWSICDNLTSGSPDAGYCYYAAAIMTESMTYCDKLPEVSAEEYTVGDCYGQIADGTGNLTLCKSLTKSSDSDECYYDYATDEYNTTICNFISDPGKKADCIMDANLTD